MVIEFIYFSIPPPPSGKVIGFPRLSYSILTEPFKQQSPREIETSFQEGTQGNQENYTHWFLRNSQPQL